MVQKSRTSSKVHQESVQLYPLSAFLLFLNAATLRSISGKTHEGSVSLLGNYIVTHCPSSA